MATRSQQDLQRAIKLVNDVKGTGKDKCEAYGRLCHSFPVMVRTCGLCQAVAFSAAKAQDAPSDANKYAHTKLLEHVAEVAGLSKGGNVAEQIAAASTADYMRYTSNVLRAWIYFKRLAVSILEVSNAAEKGGG